MPSVASLDVVSAAVIPGPFVSDPVHARFGQKLPHEFELVGTRLSIPAGNCPDGATVKVDPVVLGTEHLAIGKEPLSVEQLGEVTNTLIDRQNREFGPQRIDLSTTTPLENPVNKFRVLFLDVFEELDGQPACSRAEQVLRLFGGPEAVGRAARLTAFLMGRDQTCRSQRNEVLA